MTENIPSTPDMPLYSVVARLKSSDRAAREAAFAAIHAVFNKAQDEKKRRYHFRGAEISLSDLEYYDGHFDAAQKNLLFSIASLNCSGYVREAAVRKLIAAGNDAALPFLIYRAADWVENIRDLAIAGLAGFMRTEFLPRFLECLRDIEEMQRAWRIDLVPLYNKIMTFITEDTPRVMAYFPALPDQDRARLARFMVRDAPHAQTVALETLRIFLKDRYFVVRSTLLQQFDRLTPDEIDALLNDKSANIAVETFCRLDPAQREKVAESLLARPSAMLRYLARQSLKEKNMDFPAHYHALLSRGENTVGALRGLAETGGARDLESVKPYLDSPRPKLAQSAFFALQKLDDPAAYRFAFEHMDHAAPGMRKRIVAYLARNATLEVRARARQLYQNAPLDIRKSMLRFFHATGWHDFPEIIRGLVDAEEAIRKMSLAYCQRSLDRLCRVYSPDPALCRRVQESIHFVLQENRERRYFDASFLDRLAFYFQ
jgi:HEAT repeat protein